MEETLPDAVATLPDGIHEGVSSRHYHAIDAVGNSGTLKKIERSPLYLLRTRGLWSKPTDDTRIGSAAHCLTLQPHLYGAQFVESGRCVAITKTSGQCKNGGSFVIDGLSYCGTHRDKDAVADPREVLDEAATKRAKDIAAAVLADPHSSEVLRLATEREVTILWTDPETGLRCKGRIDIFGRGDVVRVWELKKNLHALPEEFSHEIRRRGYHRQLAWYVEGLHVLGLDATEIGIVAVQDKANDEVHEVCTYDLSIDALMLGREKNRELLRLYAQCRREDRWPGIARQPISVPAWSLRGNDDEDEGAEDGAKEVS